MSNTWFGNALFTMISTCGTTFDTNEDVNDVLRWLFADHNQILKMKSQIVTSFHGTGQGFNSTFNYLCYALQKYIKCGVIEFLLVQIYVASDKFILAAKLLLA